MNTTHVTSRCPDVASPVYLVDDDDAVRRALQLLLQTLGIPVRTFSDPRAFLLDLPSLPPGCLVLDIRMPAISGLRLQQQLRERSIDWPVIIISGHGDIEACRDAFKQGAIDFLSKPVDEQDLIDAVQKAVIALDQEQRRAAEAMESRQALDTLTAREREVLDLIVRGFTNRECAGMLGVSPRTVETHRANLAAKLGTHSLVELSRLMNASASPAMPEPTLPNGPPA